MSDGRRGREDQNAKRFPLAAAVRQSPPRVNLFLKKNRAKKKIRWKETPGGKPKMTQRAQPNAFCVFVKHDSLATFGRLSKTTRAAAYRIFVFLFGHPVFRNLFV